MMLTQWLVIPDYYQATCLAEKACIIQPRNDRGGLLAVMSKAPWLVYELLVSAQRLCIDSREVNATLPYRGLSLAPRRAFWFEQAVDSNTGQATVPIISTLAE